MRWLEKGAVQVKLNFLILCNPYLRKVEKMKFYFSVSNN